MSAEGAVYRCVSASAWVVWMTGAYTELLVLCYRLVMLPIQLCPLGEVVLRRRVPQLALQPHNIPLQGLAFLRRSGCRRRQLIVDDP